MKTRVILDESHPPIVAEWEAAGRLDWRGTDYSPQGPGIQWARATWSPDARGAWWLVAARSVHGGMVRAPITEEMALDATRTDPAEPWTYTPCGERSAQ